MSLQIVILAAGAGKRMVSKLPKVLHTLAGKPMLERVVETAEQLMPAGIHIVYGHGGELIKEQLSHLKVNWVLQSQQLGTGHAVLQALPYIQLPSQILVLSGDVPLIQTSTLADLIALAQKTHSALALLIAHLDNPTGLGRIVRDEVGRITAIVEEKDASSEHKNIKEIYSGICLVEASHLSRWLPELNSNNAQGEYYLTEIIAKAVMEDENIVSVSAQDVMEIQGVNNRLQLQLLERLWQQKKATQLLLMGVSIADVGRIDIRGDLTCGQDVFIDINAVMSGNVILGDGCYIGPNCTLTNVTLGKNCQIFANSVLEGAELDDNCHPLK